MQGIAKQIFKCKLKLKNIEERPDQLEIECTNMCNLNCIICPRKIMKRKVGVMDFSLFKKIIDEVADWNLKRITLHAYGEALMIPELAVRMINYAKEKCPKTEIFISTNCTLLNEENSKLLLNSKLDHLVLSLDGMTKETYEKIRKGANFETVVANIKRFFELKKQMKNRRLHVDLQLIKMNETIKEIEDFKKNWSSYLGDNDKIFIKNFCTFGGRVEDRRVNDIKKIGLIAKIRSYTWRNIMKKHFPCTLLWTTRVIHWDGNMVACCVDYDDEIKFGNVKENTIEEISNSDKMRKIRELHLEGKSGSIPLCKGCQEI